MKKIVFAIQVFGLIAVFPAYVVAEFSHETRKLPIDNFSSGTIKKPTKKNIRLTLNSAEQNDGVFLFMFKMNLY